MLEHGYGVARYVSVEQRMFNSKNAYYGALHASQREWHQGTHDVWPWTGYLVGVLDDAYDDFEWRVAVRRRLAGMSKQARVGEYVFHQAPVVVRLRDVRAALPGVSDQTIRLVLNELRREGSVGIDEAVGGSGPPGDERDSRDQAIAPGSQCSTPVSSIASGSRAGTFRSIAVV